MGKYYADITTRTIFKLVFSDHDSPLHKFQHLYLLVQLKFRRETQCVVEDCGKMEVGEEQLSLIYVREEQELMANSNTTSSPDWAQF